MITISDQKLSHRLKRAWNVFRNHDDRLDYGYSLQGGNDYYPSSRRPLTFGNDRTIINAIFNRIALDVAALTFRHVRVDENGQFVDVIKDPLNDRLNVEANLDQTSRAFIQDAILTLLDVGSIALVPVDADDDPSETGAYSIFSMRVGTIKSWYPQHVRVEVYNEETGHREEITLPKRMVAIIESPLYSVINEPNSVMQRLLRKLTLLDVVDERTSADRLDIIIQLPYIVRGEQRKAEADRRLQSIVDQLKGSKYGIAYADATERITQLNRPVENNLMDQIEYLMSMLYSQLGITKDVMEGTATEAVMQNYYIRTIEPFASALVDSMTRTFLTKTARTQGQTIQYYRDPFKLATLTQIADLGEKFTRAEVLTSNDVRGIIGYKPSTDPGANELRNKNLKVEDTAVGKANESGVSADMAKEENGQNEQT